MVDLGPPGIWAIKSTVADYYKVHAALFDMQDRRRSVHWPRQMAMALMRDLRSMSYREIAEAFDRCDHTTAFAAIRGLNHRRKNNPQTEQDYRNLRKILEAMREPKAPSEIPGARGPILVS